MKFSKSAALATAGLALIAASCVPTPSAVQTVRPGTSGLPPVPCEQSTASCTLPFPSMRYLTSDAATATGYRLAMPDELVPAHLLNRLGPPELFDSILETTDGFSPLTPVYFEFAENLDPASVPVDGDGLVEVTDGAGRQVPVRAQVSEWAMDRWGKQTILEVWPISRFDFGSTIHVRVTDALVALDGRAVSQTPSVLDLPATGRPGYVASTSFVVRTEENATGRTEVMEAIVRQNDHPIRGIEVGPPLLGGAATVTGQVQVTDFRESGGRIPRTGPVHPQPRWVDFVMTLPDKPAGPDGAPVVVYGHGLTAFKESMMIVAGKNAQAGFATVGIDIPNHGSRIDNGGALGELARPSQLYRLADMTLQGPLDQLSLVLAIQNHFDSIDVLPGGWPVSNPDGVSDLDTSRILYQGTSMGGFLGVATLAMAPEIEAAFLQVAGAGVIDTISHSFLWLLFEGVVPRGGDVASGHALVGAAQLLLDEADGGNLAHRVAESETPVFLTYAVDDGIVGNVTSERLSALLELPAVGPVLVDGEVPDAPAASIPRDGIGVAQIPTGYLAGNVLKDVLTHVAFLDAIPMRQLDEWLADRSADGKTE